MLEEEKEETRCFEQEGVGGPGEGEEEEVPIDFLIVLRIRAWIF